MDKKFNIGWLSGDAGFHTAEEQERILKFIALISSLLFIPFAIKNALLGEYFFTLLLVGFEISLLLEVIWLLHYQRPCFSYLVPVCLLLANGIWAIKVLGVYGAYWLFPVMVSIGFVIPLRASLLSNCIALVIAGIFGWYYLETAAVIRLIGALSITVLVSHYMLRSIHKLQSRLHEASIRDAMTSLLNRSQLEEYMLCSLNSTEHSAIAMVDIDHFKKINDSYGHDMGDRVIRLIADAILLQLGPADKAFRLGGDEFLILFNQASADEIRDKLSSISDILKSQPLFEQTLTISVGAATKQPGDTPKNWLKRADEQLYQAKDGGRDQIRFTLPQLLAEQP